MKHKIRSLGNQRYEAHSSDGKTILEIIGFHEPGPRGGNGERIWQVIQYDWLEPDEWNATGSWGSGDVIAEPRYFQRAKQVVRERLALAEEHIVAREERQRKAS